MKFFVTENTFNNASFYVLNDENDFNSVLHAYMAKASIWGGCTNRLSSGYFLYEVAPENKDKVLKTLMFMGVTQTLDHEEVFMQEVVVEAPRTPSVWDNFSGPHSTYCSNPAARFVVEAHDERENGFGIGVIGYYESEADARGVAVFIRGQGIDQVLISPYDPSAEVCGGMNPFVEASLN